MNAMPKLLKVKILLVDDRENNLLSMESILERDKYHLVKATSGTDALKILLKDWDFTLILMDVEMPVLNGFETAAMIYQREKLRHIPIIFITAHSYGDENIFKGYKAGAVDYIYKPIQPDLLRVKVSVFVDLYRKNHQLLEHEQKLKAINKNLEFEIRDRITSEEKVKELNKQLLKNIEELEAANTEMDQFVFIASHDLQEPLRKIRIFNDFISIKYKEKLDEEGKSYLDRMQVACERMQRLINDILMFSKIDTSKHSPVPTDLNELLEEVTDNMEFQIREKDAKINIARLPKLLVYPGLIKLLFQQLISNSLKFSNGDIPPEISITAHIESDDNTDDKIKVKKYWRIHVKDNGVGFEQQYADQVFTMFKRLHSNAEYVGTGIGLAICKKIVEEHKGYICAKSAVNAGAIFTISFPVEIDASAPVKEKSKMKI